MNDNFLGTQITRENINSTKIFEKVIDANNFSVEKQFLEIATSFKCRTKVENAFKAYKKVYLDKEYQLKFGNDAPISSLASAGYRIINGCIYDASDKLVCSQLFEPIGIYYNIEDETENIQCAFKLDGKWKTFITARENLLHNGKIVSLTKKGLDISTSNASQVVKYIQAIINKNRPIFQKRESLDRLGWYKDKFIPYDQEIICDAEDDFKEKYKAVSTKGDYQTWLNEMYEVRKNNIVRMLHAVSFSSVLLNRLNKKSFVTMLWGTTGDGKTVAAMTAMSIWGNPSSRDGLFYNLNNTSNFYYRVAHFFYNIPILFDELETCNIDINKLIMGLTEEVDRGKAKAEGGVQKNNTWNTAFIMTGEHSASNINSGGGTLNRLIEIDTDEKIIQNGAKTVDVITDNYGFAGKIFIEEINKMDKQELKEIYNNKVQELLKLKDTTEKQAFNMAMLLLGDELACKFIFKENQPLKATDVEKYMLTKEDVNVSQRAYEVFRGECIVNKSRFMLEVNGKTQEFTSSGEFWGKMSEWEIDIVKTKLDEILKKNGFSPKKTYKDWLKLGYLEKNSYGKYQTKTSINGNLTYYTTIKLKELK